MIPLGDATRRPINFPIATLAIIAANAIVFILELGGGDAFINHWSLVPAHITAGQDWITILTSMFMHAGWEHILGNMLFFWVFGPEIEDVMGALPFLVFYLLGGLVATLAQVLIDPTSTIPNLGASGAIAAVMGAFLITYPRTGSARCSSWAGSSGSSSCRPSCWWVSGSSRNYSAKSARWPRHRRRRRGLHGACRRVRLWHAARPAVRKSPAQTAAGAGITISLGKTSSIFRL